jgi:GntR family transcriptional regulator
MAVATKKKKRAVSQPAYKRIANSLTKDIESGKLTIGDAVPPERELASTFDVSLMTARQALQQLTQEGLLTRRPCVGTFVAPPKIQFNRLTGFTEEMLRRGCAPRSRVLAADRTDKDEEACARLALPFGSEIVRLQRLRMSDDEAFAVETCYMEAKRFAGILEEHFERRSLFETLSSSYGIRISYADEEVDSTAADSRTASLLGLQTGAPILRIRQLLFGSTGPIVYSTALYRSDRHAVIVRRYR